MQRRHERRLGTLLELARGTVWTCTGLFGFACLFAALTGSRYGAWFLALYVTGTVLGLWLARRRWPWRPVLLLACQFALVSGLWAWRARGPDRHELPAEGDGFIVALEDHHRRHGRYPVSLAEAGCSPRWNAYGGWRYEALDGGASYYLGVGDYLEDGFVLYRYRHDPDWYWDT